MGISKAMMEKVFIAKSRTVDPSKTLICGTRYGNVMASRGSVIPLFIEQIKHNLPITVTDPNMTRFLMSLEEAVELVLHSFVHGKQGDIMVQKSPASTVEDLAKALMEMFGNKSKIKVIGTRHGEKLYETLLTKEEFAVSEDMGNYYRIPADNRDLNYDVYVSSGSPKLSALTEYNSHNTQRLKVNEIITKLVQLEEVKEALVGWKK
jgi:UDP-glucose 4-epimerase